jgi:hypothetical protein
MVFKYPICIVGESAGFQINDYLLCKDYEEVILVFGIIYFMYKIMSIADKLIKHLFILFLIIKYKI